MKTNSMLFSIIQLFGTLLILGSPLSNVSKAIAFLIFWSITFFPIQKKEIILFIAINILFLLTDYFSLKKGIFYFKHPDLLGMPYYEFFLWGFYILHAFRTLGFKEPKNVKRNRLIWIPLILYSISFFYFSKEIPLFIATTIGVIFTLVLFHEKEDWLYFGYFIWMGTLVEYVGVLSGNWGYPEPFLGSVALWYLTLWGGVGLFSRRIIALLLSKMTPK